MKTVYTHPFKERAGADTPEGAALLEAVTYVFLEHNWRNGLRNWNFPRVLSPYWRLLHSRAGFGCVSTEAARVPLTAGNLVLIPNDVETALSASGPIDMFWAHFLVLMPPLFRISPVFRRPIELRLSAPAEGLIEHIIALHKGAERHPTVVLLFRALLDWCMADILGPVLAESAGYPSDLERVMAVLTHVQAHYGERLSNARLGALIGVGPDQLMKLFRRVTGRRVHAHVVEVRVQAATRALVETDKSIKQVAAECGFTNRHYFSRVFCKRLGMGPATYRRRFHRQASALAARSTA